MIYKILTKLRPLSNISGTHGVWVFALVEVILLLSATFLYADSASCDTSCPDAKDDKGISTSPARTKLREDVGIDYTYVGSADLKSGASGSLDEQTSHFHYSVTVPATDQLSVRFGLNYSRFDFGQPAASLLPSSLETLTASLGTDYKLTDQWTVFESIAPRLEIIDGWNQIESNNLEVAGTVGATYEPDQDLSFRFGLAVNPGSIGVPVLPLLALRWQFQDAWVLNLGFPRTSIDYQIMPNLRLSPIEASFEGGSFHTGKNYGTVSGNPDLNDRKLNYREVRAGVGADYAVMTNVHVGLDAGAVVYREFDFDDASLSPKVDPAPFVQLSVKLGF